METKAAGGTFSAEEALRRPCRIQDDRIRLRGRPGDLVGVVSMQREPVPREAFKIATADISETEFGYLRRLHFSPLISTTLPGDQPQSSGLSVEAMVPAGSAGRVPVRFSAARTTPPGTYEAVFDVGGSEQAADIEVLADEALEIIPRSVAIAGPPGAVLHEEVILRNIGNVRLEIDVLGLMVLQEEEQVCLGLQHALARTKAGEEEGAHRRFLDALAFSLAGRKTDLGRVRVADGPCGIDPGDAVPVTLAFHLPRDMIGGRQYRALVKARAAQLFVRIVAEPGGSAPETSTNEPQRKQRGQREPAR